MSIAIASLDSARKARLRFTTDAGPGLRRIRKGKNFKYVDAAGRPCNEATIARIKSLVIPPAWEDVWICPSDKGHIQATGRDERGRKQYRYHVRWREVRDTSKYGRMVAFAEVLPKIRETVDGALKKPLSRTTLLASVIHLLERTHIRIGNDEYAKTNGHFGLTTLRENHVRVDGSKMYFRFLGKSGVKRVIDLNDRRIARVIVQCQELPGHELFHYEDEDGRVRRVSSGDVNRFLKETAGQKVTAKDFRTWAGTVLAARSLADKPHESPTEAKRNIVAAVKEVSARLGNTPAVCRKCYIHPAVLDAYTRNELKGLMSKPRLVSKSSLDLSLEERAVLDLIRGGQRLRKAA